tara:strand:+ start:504 stop:656 length:153 start_codon:yes stop_codon:yes gene_type:complete
VSDDEKKTYADGIRDGRLQSLERRMSLIEKLIWTLAGLVAASWAKLQGLF